MTLLQELAVTSADKTFIALRSAIVEGELISGSKLNEAELSTTYQVSRAVIREAINRLETCYLVERKSNVGARVVELTHQGLIQLYEVRESLEGMAARLAAKNMTAEEKQELQSLLDSHYQKVQGGLNYYQEAGDVDFHYRIILGSKNEQLISLLINGLYHLIRMYRVQFGMTGPRISTAFDEHQHIVKAIINEDPELAEILMRRHILYSRQSVERKLNVSDSSTINDVKTS